MTDVIAGKPVGNVGSDCKELSVAWNRGVGIEQSVEIAQPKRGLHINSAVAHGFS